MELAGGARRDRVADDEIVGNDGQIRIGEQLLGDFQGRGPRIQVDDTLPRDHSGRDPADRSEEHTSELQSLMRISYAVFCLKKKNIPLNCKYDVNYHKITTLTRITN